MTRWNSLTRKTAFNWLHILNFYHQLSSSTGRIFLQIEANRLGVLRVLNCFFLIHAISSLFDKDCRNLNSLVNRLLPKMLVFLIIDFKILGRVEKKILSREHHFQRHHFWYFQTATCYDSSLVLSGLDPALFKAAYSIACPQLNGDALISLYALLLMLERVWTLLPRFLAADTKVMHVQDYSYVIATNKLKKKVLKNNTMNGKSLRIIWMVKEGQKGDSIYYAQLKALPLIKRSVASWSFT